jgi:predicted amino acid dehydrogenase
LKRILHYKFEAECVPQSYVMSVLGETYAVDEKPATQDIKKIRTGLATPHEGYDAVAGSGSKVAFYHGGKVKLHAGLEDLPLHKADKIVTLGFKMANVVERHLVRRTLNEICGDNHDCRVLMLSGLEHPGVAEVVADHTKNVVFGDLIFSTPLGIPLRSLASLDRFARAGIPMFLKVPLALCDPRMRGQRPTLRPFQWWFDWAEIVIGSMAYLRRFAPESLDGKVVITDFTDNDLPFLKSKEVMIAASHEAHIDGRPVPPGLLQAVYLLEHREGATTGPQDGMLEMVHKLKVEPRIERLAPGALGMQIDPGTAERILVPKETMGRSEDGVGRFAFVLHPLKAEQLFRHPGVRGLRRKMPAFWLERALSRAPSILVDHITGVVSKTGAKAEGWIFAVPITPREMLRLPTNYVYRRLAEVAQWGGKLGAGVLGLGAYTSVVGDAGETVAKMSPIAVTSGNTYTVAATIESIEVAAKRIDVDLKECTALVIGATGSIGSAISHILARKTAAVRLASPRPERLLELAGAIESRLPGVDVRISTSVERFLPEADIVVTTTSAVGSIVKVDRLKPGVLVCDVARPPDISEESARRRPDVLVFEAGEILAPCTLNLTFDIGLPPNTIYGCLAETMILALERRYENFTLGRRMDVEKVDEMATLGVKHGFRLAPLTTFGRELTEADFDRVASARRRPAVNRV